MEETRIEDRIEITNNEDGSTKVTIYDYDVDMHSFNFTLDDYFEWSSEANDLVPIKKYSLNTNILEKTYGVEMLEILVNIMKYLNGEKIAFYYYVIVDRRKEFPDFLKRMIDEEKELFEKVDKLIEFKKTEKFNNLGETQKELLEEQLYYMLRYNHILKKRIEYEKSLNGDTDGDK